MILTKRVSKIWPREARMQPTDLPHSWGVSVLHQGELNSSSGISMTAKCKMIWIVAVPYSSCGRVSWSGTDPPLVAVLFLHQRRGRCPSGKATAEDKNPYLLSESFICVV